MKNYKWVFFLLLGSIFSIHARAQNTTVLCNVTITKNTATDSVAIFNSNGSIQILNSIIWGNKNGKGSLHISKEAGGTDTISYSIVEGRAANATSPNVDPKLDTAGALLAGSPAIDAGLDAAYNAIVNGQSYPAQDGSNQTYTVGNTKDLAGNPRKLGKSVDMGAYEAAEALVIEPEEWDCANLTNRVVDFAGQAPFTVTGKYTGEGSKLATNDESKMAKAIEVEKEPGKIEIFASFGDIYTITDAKGVTMKVIRPCYWQEVIETMFNRGVINLKSNFAATYDLNDLETQWIRMNGENDSIGTPLKTGKYYTRGSVAADPLNDQVYYAAILKTMQGDEIRVCAGQYASTKSKAIVYPNPIAGGGTASVEVPRAEGDDELPGTRSGGEASFTNTSQKSVVEEIKVYDLGGHLISTYPLEGSFTTMPMPKEKGVYFIKVAGETVKMLVE
ncbi:hypothetical protein FACS1894199_18600 [Bacteroidia bacterium]|nr:hypothetical protein FACS1894199_18600 [Bacteroidia bacterium]